MQKSNFICSSVSEEVAILSDGRITSCCVDGKGNNTFASIYEDEPASAVKKLRDFKKKLVGDINELPTCVECVRARRNYYNDFHTFNASDREVSEFISTDSMPKRLVIELTSVCNMSCSGCISGRKEVKEYRNVDNGRFLDTEVLKKWLKPFLNDLKAVRLYNYGETFLHPGAIDFCSFLTRNQPHIYVGIATNLLPLDNENKISHLVNAQPNLLLVSLHGAGRESVKKYMGPHADFDKTIELMKKIIEKRQEAGLDYPVVAWKYLLFEWNDSDKEMSKAKEILEKNKIDFLSFELANSPFASKRYVIGSKDFERLKESEFYINNVFREFKKLKLKRRARDI